MASPSPLLDQALRLEGLLRRVIAGYCKNASDIEEVLQETYTLIYQVGLNAPQIHRTRAWIVTIARNSAVNHFRHHRARPADPAGDPAIFDVEDEAPSAEDAVSSAQELALVLEALERMPERRRQVFWRRRVLGVSPEQIAIDLGITLNTVEAHLQQARTQLATCLGEIDAERGTDLSSRLRKRKNQG